MQVKIKGKAVTSATAGYISLVDHPANSIPFRFIKKEKQMNLETALSNMFTKQETVQASTIPETLLAVIIPKGDASHILEKNDDFVKSIQDDGSVTYRRKDADLDKADTSIVGNNEEGFAIVEKMNLWGEDLGTLAERIDAGSFFPTFHEAFYIASDEISYALWDIENKADAKKMIKGIVTELGVYLDGLIENLPTAVFTKREEPETVEVAEPETVEVAEPEAVEVAEPEVAAVAEPEAVEVAEPEVAAVAEPEAEVVAEPEAEVVADPELEAENTPDSVEKAEDAETKNSAAEDENQVLKAEIESLKAKLTSKADIIQLDNVVANDGDEEPVKEGGIFKGVFPGIEDVVRRHRS